MSGAIPPLPNTPSWRGAQLKQRDNFTFYVQKLMYDITYIDLRSTTVILYNFYIYLTD
jgi:hypothetical protein